MTVGFYITSSKGIGIMLKSEFVKIKVSSGFKQNYSGLGYNLGSEEVDLKISDLKEVSNYSNSSILFFR